MKKLAQVELLLIMSILKSIYAFSISSHPFFDLFGEVEVNFIAQLLNVALQLIFTYLLP